MAHRSSSPAVTEGNRDARATTRKINWLELVVVQFCWWWKIDQQRARLA
jgi:putative NADPH-quinone reductase